MYSIYMGSDPQIHYWLNSGGPILLLPFSVLDPHTGSRILSQPHAVASGCWANILPLQMLSDQILSLPLSLFSGLVEFQFLDSLDGVYRDWLTLSESEYCPTSFPTVSLKGSV